QRGRAAVRPAHDDLVPAPVELEAGAVGAGERAWRGGGRWRRVRDRAGIGIGGGWRRGFVRARLACAGGGTQGGKQCGPDGTMHGDLLVSEGMRRRGNAGARAVVAW